MSTLKVNELRHLSNSSTANVVLESNATTNLQATSTLGLTVNGTLTVSGVATFNGNMVVGNASTDTVTLTSTISGSANYSGFTGEIRMYAGNAAGDSSPQGWLYCNGDTINQTSGTSPDHHNSDGTGNDYQPLYNLLKASADWGNTGSLTWGTNNVKLPDFRSRSPVGVHTGAANALPTGLTQRTLGDGTSIADGSTLIGKETHVLTTAEMPTHTHVATTANSLTGQVLSATHTHPMSHYHSMSHTHPYTNPLIGTFTGMTHDINGTAVEYPTVNAGTTGGSSSANTGTYGGSTSNNTSISLSDPQHNHSTTNANAGSSSAHTILSPIIAVHYIIKV